MMGVPTFYTRLLAEPRFDAASCGSMRLFISGSAPLLASVHDEFRARVGHAILERYGMTETTMLTSNPLDGERRAGTVGMPLPGVDVRVVGDDGRGLPTGEVGGIEEELMSGGLDPAAIDFDERVAARIGEKLDALTRGQRLEEVASDRQGIARQPALVGWLNWGVAHWRTVATA